MAIKKSVLAYCFQRGIPLTPSTLQDREKLSRCRDFGKYCFLCHPLQGRLFSEILNSLQTQTYHEVHGITDCTIHLNTFFFHLQGIIKLLPDQDLSIWKIRIPKQTKKIFFLGEFILEVPRSLFSIKNKQTKQQKPTTPPAPSSLNLSRKQ